MPHISNHIAFPERKLVMMLIPKAANTSIKAMLLRMMGYRVPQLNERISQRMVLLHNHPAFRFIHTAQAYHEYSDCERWAVVRHPVERVRSTFADIGGGKEVWGQFLGMVCQTPDPQANIHMRSQYHQLCLEDYRHDVGTLVPTRVFRADVKEEMDFLLALLWDRFEPHAGLHEMKEWPRLNESKGIKPIVSDEQYAALHARYHLDFMAFYAGAEPRAAQGQS